MEIKQRPERVLIQIVFTLIQRTFLTSERIIKQLCFLKDTLRHRFIINYLLDRKYKRVKLGLQFSYYCVYIFFCLTTHFMNNLDFQTLEIILKSWKALLFKRVFAFNKPKVLRRSQPHGWSDDGSKDKEPKTVPYPGNQFYEQPLHHLRRQQKIHRAHPKQCELHGTGY